MKTVHEAAFSNTIPGLAAGEHSYAIILGLGGYDPSFFLPDEVEDLLSVIIRRAILHVDLATSIDAEENVPFFASMFAILAPFTDANAFNVDNDAYVSGTSIDEYIMADGGDNPLRKVQHLIGSRSKSEIVGVLAGPAFYVQSRWKQRVDVTALMKDSFKNLETTQDEETPVTAIGIYIHNGGEQAITWAEGSSRFFFEIDWDYKINPGTKGGINLAKFSSQRSGSKRSKR